ncbi:hypothetical protein VC83_06436 [Pseudogymnoascus destructans]|uniref:DUF7732 domain-containing protein n=2 Tax=Pseudogymnoascus destructans TaxID=655981 RepID=L8FZC8_PSED2|nr:uncharacterized protein VC83_06436 [Pseudogymnoascus destructans]ELR05889.1 hypothetical protein GMDG_07662 [Pseudogymnoascus destructans 20631-21]OAF58307.1 hypothetical protein VC83_06436 [Pseudogymnoascus destructans]
MKFSVALILSIALSSTANALVPRAELVVRDSEATVQQLEVREAEGTFDASEELWKRKGGGGAGGRGGGSSGGSSGGRTGGAGTSSGGSSGAGRGTGLGSSSSSTGGQTRTGSGPSPAYGGGGYYGGGAAVPYRTGAATRSGISPVLLGVGVGLGVGVLAYGLAGTWHHPVYSYPYKNTWTFYNITVDANQTKPVQCLCEEYSECGCDDNDNAQYQKDVLGNGSYAGLNKSVVSVADIQGKSTIILNGTLPNGTTAAGGTEEADGSTDSSSGTSTAATNGAFSLTHGMMQSGVYCIMAAAVGSAVFLA